MKKLFIMLLCLLIAVFAGCTSAKKNEVPPPQSRPDTDTIHLTAEDKGMVLSVSRNIRPIPQMNIYTKEGFEVVSILVKVENNSKADIPVSPEFVTLQTSEGTAYKYSPSLTQTQPVGKSAFTSRTIPPDYQGGGLLIFEIKKGSRAESLTYKDTSGHNLTIKFPQDVKTNI